MTPGQATRRCTLLSGIRVERGTMADWRALAPLHYRSHYAGAVTDVFRVTYHERTPRAGEATAPLRSRLVATPTQAPPQLVAAPTQAPPRLVATPTQAPPRLVATPTQARPRLVAAPTQARPRLVAAPTQAPPRVGGPVLVGVLVVSRPALSLGARDRATGGRYRTAGMGRVATAGLINRELRVISRVVIAPNWRGLGLASFLVGEALPEIGTPYVEAMAAMGRVHPFFERAGMTAYPQAPSPHGERLRACLEAVGLARCDRRSAEALGCAIDALPGGAACLVWREIGRWARSYLGAKNHRTNRPDRGRMLDLVARHLDSAPVYYLWRRKDRA